MRRRTFLGTTAAAAALGARPAAAQADPDAVDVLLVLAVDVSRSVDEDEARLQREGYRNAVPDPVVVEAIRGGMIGAIGLAYVEWAGAEYQRLVLPWTRIAGQGDAFAWATRSDEAPRAPCPGPPSPARSISPAAFWPRRPSRGRGGWSTCPATA